MRTKIIITIILSTILLQACWLKKCENPDAEHCSWTMVEPGRTANYIFKSKFGDSLICKAFPPTFGKFRNSSSSLDECVGQVYSCKIGVHYLQPPTYQWGGTEDINWSTLKYENGTHETNLSCTNTDLGIITYKNDTMKVELKSFAKQIKISYVEIIKNRDIRSFILNDTIYEKIN